MNMISLLVAVVIASISYVAFYKTMGGFQASQQRPVEIVDVEWILRNTHETFLWQMVQAQTEQGLSAAPSNIVELIYTLPYFEENIAVPLDDGLTYSWEIDPYHYELRELDTPSWFELSVENKKREQSFKKSLIWKARF